MCSRACPCSTWDPRHHIYLSRKYQPRRSFRPNSMVEREPIFKLLEKPETLRSAGVPVGVLSHSDRELRG